MKGMKNRVMAFVLAFIMIIANVMTVAATEGADTEKYVNVGVDAYGGTFSKMYWDQGQWMSEGEVSDAWYHLNVADGSLREANLWKMEQDPVKQGATFEGWAKFYYRDTNGDEIFERVFEAKSSAASYYTTDEMFDAAIPEEDVTYAAKWSDVAISDYYKEYNLDVYEYGENCLFKYLDSEWIEGKEEPVWNEMAHGGFSLSAIAGFSIQSQIEHSFQIKEDPTRPGATFEGWARFKEENGVYTFMPQSSKDPYFTTEEMMNSTMPGYHVHFSPKWSDIDIEDYHPIYFQTVLDANGGKVSFSYSGKGDEDEVRVDEFESKIHMASQTARKSLKQLLEENEGKINGINKPGEILKDWTLYQAETVVHAFYEEGETVVASTENRKVIPFDTFTDGDGTKVNVYLIVEGYKLIANNVSTEKILNDYKGANYYAVANWEKSIELVENKEVTATLQKELEDIIAKKDTVKESVISKETLYNVEMASQAGKEIKPELVVYPVQESMIDTKEKTSIVTEVTKELGKDAKIQYLDIQVMLKADDEKLGNIHELTKEIEITIAIPENMKAEGGKYVVLRNHNGKVDVLDVKRNADGTVTFKTDRFSTYALAYVQEAVVVSPKTGDTSAIVGYAALCVMALAVVVWKKKEFLVK